MGGLRSAGRSRAHSQPWTMCVFVCLVASKSVTLFREQCKREWGLPDGKHPERHRDTAQRGHIMRGSQHTGAVHRWKCANHSPGQGLGNTDKVRPQLPRLSEKLKNQDDSLDRPHLLRSRKSGGNGKPRCGWAHRRAAGRQTD